MITPRIKKGPLSVPFFANPESIGLGPFFEFCIYSAGKLKCSHSVVVLPKYRLL